MRHTTLFVALLLTTTALFAQRIEATQPFGGMAAVERMIEQELNYPLSALEVGIKGDVTVVVGVNSDGTVQAMQVWKQVCPECDAEALRLASLIIWQPSTASEERGSADHYLVIPFDPVKYKRWKKNRSDTEAPVFELPVADTLGVYLPRNLDTQVVPLVPKGNAGLGRYLADRMRYPEEAFRRSIEGNVKVQFVVEPSGSISNLVVVEELGGGCTAEAIRLVYKTPWAPGTKNGERVRSHAEVSIRFTLPQQR